MTDQSPWSEGANLPKPSSASSKRSVSVVMIVVLLVLGLCIGATLTWIVNWATLANMERDRSLAVSNLAALATKVEEAQEIARNSKKAIDDAVANEKSMARQAEEASRQLGDARKDASSVRTERDEARGLTTAMRGEIDRLKMMDADPSTMPIADLSKAINSVKIVRCIASVSLRTPAPGVDDAMAKNFLTRALASGGIACGEQSTVEMLVLVSLSEDQPRRALAVMLLVTRVLKVPGVSFSKPASVWGQQRTSLVNDASASTQLDSMIQELVAAMNVDLASNAPAIVAPPVATPPMLNPTTPVATPAATPVAPPVAPPVATPAATPAAPPAVTPANGKP